MKSKIFKGKKGLTLTGIIAALILAVALLFISLPLYLDWITKGLAVRALIALSHDRDQLEACIQAHPHNETICQISVKLHSDRYFYYSLVPPQRHGSKAIGAPAPRDGFPDWNLYAWDPGDADYFKDYIQLSRNGMYTLSPKITCTANGIYSGVC